MRALVPLLTVALLAGGCSHRDRANPLDPANPATGGRPTGFEAVAGNSRVDLHWNAPSGVVIDGFSILRLAAGDSLFRPLADLGPAETRFGDFGVGNGRPFTYRIAYVVGGARSVLYVEDHATPGPLRPWVIDGGAGELVRLAPDGRHVSFRVPGFGASTSLAVDPATGLIWTSDPDGGTVRLTNSSLVSFPLTGVPRPYTLAASPTDHSAWICDLGGGVVHYLPNTHPGVPARISLLERPTGIGFDAFDGSFWVCEYAGNRVRHYSELGILLATTRAFQPRRVAVDSLSHVAWVPSPAAGLVYRIAPDGQIADSLAVGLTPAAIALDWYRERAWIADPDANRVLGVNIVTGVIELSADGIGAPMDLAVDLGSGDVWVVASAEAAIVRLAPDGRVLERLAGFTNPAEVRLDPGTR